MSARKKALVVVEADVVEAAPAGALSPAMQEIARSYVAARRKTGEGLLESAAWMAAARERAAHGEWGLFLAATGTSKSTADRLIGVHTEAEQNPLYRQKILEGWLGASVAALIAQSESPAQLLERLILEEAAPSLADVRAAEAPVKSPNLGDLPPTQHPAPSSGGNTAQALPAPLAAVADALARGDEKAAYTAARGVGPAHVSQAYAAVDAHVDDRPLEEALALLAAPALPPGWAWRQRGDGMFQAHVQGGTGLTATYPPTGAQAAADEAWSISRRGATPAPPPPAPSPAEALEAMVADTRADLVARAADAGYTLTWNGGGAGRLVQTATGAPYGGVRDLEEARQRVEALERNASQAAQREATPAVVAGDATPEEAFRRFKQDLAILLADDVMPESLAWGLCAVLDLEDDIDDPREALEEELTARARRNLPRIVRFMALAERRAA
jgi:hypothetical protein